MLSFNFGHFAVSEQLCAKQYQSTTSQSPTQLATLRHQDLSLHWGISQWLLLHRVWYQYFHCRDNVKSTDAIV